MADAYPKAALLFGSGETAVRVWVRVDVVERNAGLWPDMITAVAPVHEWQKLGGAGAPAWTDPCALELYFSSPATADVTLDGLQIDHVEDAVSGKEIGDAAASVKVKRIVLIDRRWEFSDDQGGHAYYGKVNPTDKDGDGVDPDAQPPGFLDTGSDTRQLIGQLLQYDMQYSSGLGAYGLEDPGLPLGLAEFTPRDLNWDDVHVPSEIERLLEMAEATWILDVDGDYRIEMLGEGDAPSLLNELPSDENAGRNRAPETVVITSAPRRIITEIELPFGTDDPARFVYVGVDDEGIKLLDDLNYKPAGMTWTEVVQNHYVDIPAENDQMMARQTVFKMLWVQGPDRNDYLPFCRRAVSVKRDGGGGLGWIGRYEPIEIDAIHARLIDGQWHNTSGKCRIGGYEVNPVDGIIIFPNLLGKVRADGVTGFQRNFEPLGEGELTVRMTVEETSGGDYTDFYHSGWTLTGGVLTQLSAASVADAMSSTATGTQIISVPEFLETRLGDTPTNKDALDALAGPIAERLLLGSTISRTRRYKGIQSISPNGNIPAVRWNLAEGITEVDWQQYHMGKSRYMSRRALANMARNATSGGSAARTLPGQVADGTRDAALAPMSAPGAWPHTQTDSMVVEFGMLTATQQGAFATVTLDPCDADGADNGEDNVVCFLKADRSNWHGVLDTSMILPFVRFAAETDASTYSPVNGQVLGSDQSIFTARITSTPNVYGTVAWEEVKLNNESWASSWGTWTSGRTSALGRAVAWSGYEFAYPGDIVMMVELPNYDSDASGEGAIKYVYVGTPYLFQAASPNPADPDSCDAIDASGDGTNTDHRVVKGQFYRETVVRTYDGVDYDTEYWRPWFVIDPADMGVQHPYDSPPAAVAPDSAADAGTSEDYARGDHRHEHGDAGVEAASGAVVDASVAANVFSITPVDVSLDQRGHTRNFTDGVGVDVGVVPTPGGSGKYLRSSGATAGAYDWADPSDADPVDVDPDEAADAGASADLSRADHRHAHGAPGAESRLDDYTIHAVTAITNQLTIGTAALNADGKGHITSTSGNCDETDVGIVPTPPGANAILVSTNNGVGTYEWLSSPAGPAILAYDATSGVHWVSLTAACHGAFRSSGDTIESTPQKATS